MEAGTFITVEGIEGAGKSTHAAHVADLLSGRGRRVCRTREPGGTPGGERLRELLVRSGDFNITPLTELLLMFAARAQHLDEIIVPALERNEIVICDRFTDSTYAYQGGGRGVDPAVIRELERIVQRGRRPDLTLWFDVSVETGLGRAHRRSDADRFESESKDFFERVRSTYLEIARREPDRVQCIDANGPVEDVQKEIRSILEARQIL